MFGGEWENERAHRREGRKRRSPKFLGPRGAVWPPRRRRLRITRFRLARVTKRMLKTARSPGFRWKSLSFTGHVRAGQGVRGGRGKKSPRKNPFWHVPSCDCPTAFTFPVFPSPFGRPRLARSSGSTTYFSRQQISTEIAESPGDLDGLQSCLGVGGEGGTHPRRGVPQTPQDEQTVGDPQKVARAGAKPARGGQEDRASG